MADPICDTLPTPLVWPTTVDRTSGSTSGIIPVAGFGLDDGEYCDESIIETVTIQIPVTVDVNGPATSDYQITSSVAGNTANVTWTQTLGGVVNAAGQLSGSASGTLEFTVGALVGEPVAALAGFAVGLTTAAGSTVTFGEPTATITLNNDLCPEPTEGEPITGRVTICLPVSQAKDCDGNVTEVEALPTVVEGVVDVRVCAECVREWTPVFQCVIGDYPGVGAGGRDIVDGDQIIANLLKDCDADGTILGVTYLDPTDPSFVLPDDMQVGACPTPGTVTPKGCIQDINGDRWDVFETDAGTVFYVNADGTAGVPAGDPSAWVSCCDCVRLDGPTKLCAGPDEIVDGPCQYTGQGVQSALNAAEAATINGGVIQFGSGSNNETVIDGIVAAAPSDAWIVLWYNIVGQGSGTITFASGQWETASDNAILSYRVGFSPACGVDTLQGAGHHLPTGSLGNDSSYDALVTTAGGTGVHQFQIVRYEYWLPVSEQVTQPGADIEVPLFGLDDCTIAALTNPDTEPVRECRAGTLWNVWYERDTDTGALTEIAAADTGLPCEQPIGDVVSCSPACSVDAAAIATFGAVGVQSADGEVCSFDQAVFTADDLADAARACGYAVTAAGDVVTFEAEIGGVVLADDSVVTPVCVDRSAQLVKVCDNPIERVIDECPIGDDLIVRSNCRFVSPTSDPAYGWTGGTSTSWGCFHGSNPAAFLTEVTDNGDGTWHISVSSPGWAGCPADDNVLVPGAALADGLVTWNTGSNSYAGSIGAHAPWATNVVATNTGVEYDFDPEFDTFGLCDLQITEFQRHLDTLTPGLSVPTNNVAYNARVLLFEETIEPAPTETGLKTILAECSINGLADALADCPTETFESVACASGTSETVEGTPVAVGDYVLRLVTRDCNFDVVNESRFHVASGEEITQPVQIEQCDPQPDIETTQTCVRDTAGNEWTQISIIDPADGSVLGTAWYDIGGNLGQPEGDPADWTHCQDRYVEYENEKLCEIDAEFLLLVDSGGGFAKVSFYDGSVTPVALPVPSAGTGADFDNFLLYAITSGGDLLTVDVNTNMVVSQVPLSTSDGSPLSSSASAFNPATGDLMIWANSRLYAVNVATAEVSLWSGPWTGVSGSGASMAIDPTTGNIYVAGSQGRVYEIPDGTQGASGAVTLAYNSPNNGANGMTFDADGFLYMGCTACSSEVVKVDLAAGTETEFVSNWAPGVNSLAFYRVQAPSPSCFHRRFGVLPDGSREIIGDFYIADDSPRTILGDVDCCECSCGGSGETSGPTGVTVVSTIQGCTTGGAPAFWHVLSNGTYDGPFDPTAVLPGFETGDCC